MNQLSPGLLLRILPVFLWNLGLAAAFTVTWYAPDTLGERSVHKLTFLMLVEFLVVHSTGFFSAIAGPRTASWSHKKLSGARGETLTRSLMFAGLMLFYVLFALGFSAAYGGLWPFMAFLLVALPKFPAVALHPLDDDGQFRAMAAWAVMTALYLFGCFLTVATDVPPLGITADVIAAQRFGIEGIWPEEPYRVMAFGTVYFGGLAMLASLIEYVEYSAEKKRRGA